tara:strand:- start:172 stop:867 length:696 start_codon:yes stop_codon:yes gene_type:complete
MSTKPLGQKAYGHIPHLPGSRLGPGDHCVHTGQLKICTQKARDKHDVVIVQEKVDGSNVAIARVEGNIIPLTRSGYRAETSPYEQHHFFAKWVYRDISRFEWLEEGERIVGEWMAQAHGTRYELIHEPFVAFDIMRKIKRLPFSQFMIRVALGGFVVPRLIHFDGPIDIPEVLRKLEPSGHGAIDKVEGAVWRVERRGEVDFLAKYVRPDKEDGIYLPEVSGKDPIWHWHP